VSGGPSSVLVPYVIGDTQAQAVSTLQSANLTSVVICQPTGNQAQDGLVQAQSPNGGQSEAPGTAVDITVASFSGCSGGPTSTTPPASTTTTG